MGIAGKATLPCFAKCDELRPMFAGSGHYFFPAGPSDSWLQVWRHQWQVPIDALHNYNFHANDPTELFNWSCKYSCERYSSKWQYTIGCSSTSYPGMIDDKKIIGFGKLFNGKISKLLKCSFFPSDLYAWMQFRITLESASKGVIPLLCPHVIPFRTVPAIGQPFFLLTKRMCSQIITSSPF